MNNYKELKIWRKSVDLTVRLYEVTQGFPKDEQYGLTAQVRRCAISIPSNIAEGAGRNSRKEFSRFLGLSNGSSCELETQLIIAREVGLIDQEIFESLVGELTEIQKMNWSLSKTLTVE